MARGLKGAGQVATSASMPCYVSGHEHALRQSKGLLALWPAATSSASTPASSPRAGGMEKGLLSVGDTPDKNNKA
eukprot:4605026-Amphidinium_carterae.1